MKIKVVNCTATRQGENLSLDTSTTINEITLRQHLKPPIWGSVCAPTYFETPLGTCIALVQRIGDVPNSGKWAVWCAGGIESTEELMHPDLALQREIEEEINIYYADEKITNRLVMYPISEREVFINDNFGRYGRVIKGELFEHNGVIFYIVEYTVDDSMDYFHELTLFDGEIYNGKQLDRKVALVPVDEDFNGVVNPAVVYQGMNRQPNDAINLTGYQTPTMEWLRGRWT